MLHITHDASRDVLGKTCVNDVDACRHLANAVFHVATVDDVCPDTYDVADTDLDAQPSLLKADGFLDEDADGPVDTWLEHITAPHIAPTRCLELPLSVFGAVDLIGHGVLSASYAVSKVGTCVLHVYPYVPA